MGYLLGLQKINTKCGKTLNQGSTVYRMFFWKPFEEVQEEVRG
jgi:hypothetical protein